MYIAYVGTKLDRKYLTKLISTNTLAYLTAVIDKGEKRFDGTGTRWPGT